MSERDVVEQVVVPEVPKVIPNQELYVYIPNATYDKKGVASFNRDNFGIDNGQVSIKEEYIDGIVEEAFDERGLNDLILKDFTVDPATGIGTKYYLDGTTTTIQFPTGGSGGGTVFESAAVTVLTFTTNSFVQDGDTYSIAFSPLQTGFDDNEFITNLAEATTVNDTTGYVQRADAFFLGSDGSILLDGIATPFNGRLILLGKAVLEGQIVSGVSLLGMDLQISFIGGATQTIPLAELFKKQSITIPANVWVNKSATVSVTGMTADAAVWVSYAESSYQLWKDAGIRCTAQGEGTLTFTCDFDAPAQSVTANIVFWG